VRALPPYATFRLGSCLFSFQKKIPRNLQPGVAGAMALFIIMTCLPGTHPPQLCSYLFVSNALKRACCVLIRIISFEPNCIILRRPFFNSSGLRHVCKRVLFGIYLVNFSFLRSPLPPPLLVFFAVFFLLFIAESRRAHC